MDRVEAKLKLLKPVLPFPQWEGLRISYTFESSLKGLEGTLQVRIKIDS